MVRVIGLALICVPMAALAGGSAELAVSGTLRPSSCNVSLDSDTLDLGHLHVSDLNPIETEYTHFVDLDNKVLIGCDGPTQFAMKARDLSTGGGNTRERYGLGLGSNGKATGYFVMTEQYNGALADGVAAYVTASEDLQGWTGSTDASVPFSQGAYYLGVNKIKGATSGPAFVGSASMWLSIAVYVAPKIDLVLEDELNLAGHVSFDIEYL